MPEQVNAHCFGSNFVFTDSFKSPAVRRINQKRNKYKADKRYKEDIAHIVQRRNILNAQRAVGNTLRIGNPDTDYFRKAERCYCKVVAAQTQHRRTNHKRKQRGKHAAQKQRCPQRQLYIRNKRIHRHGVKNIFPEFHRYGKNTYRVSANGHKTCLPQRKLPYKAVG